MTTLSVQFFEVLLNLIEKILAISKGLSEELNLQLLCYVILRSLPRQYNILHFTMHNFTLDDYSGQPNFANHTILKQKIH